jgi:hypothetical protein
MCDHYQIRISGHIDQGWSDWFDALTITTTRDGDTLLSGPIRDQAQLHGLLARVRDLALPLVSVNRLRPLDQGCQGSAGRWRGRHDTPPKQRRVSIELPTERGTDDALP